MISLSLRKPMTGWSDDRLLSELYRGNQEAIVYFFYTKYSATFQYHIYSLFESRADVQELVDEFFLYLFEDDWRRLRTFDASKSSLNTWISTVSFRFFKDFKQRQIDMNGVITINDTWETFQGDWCQNNDQGIMVDVTAAIASVRNERDREIARRLFIDDADYDTIATEFGLNVDYVYTVKNRLVKQLKQKLQAYGQ